MSGTTRVRPSQRAALPEGVVDPLLWRLAFDVASAHEPGEDRRCGNPQCVAEPGPCTSWTIAQRAMWVAGASATARHRPAPRIRQEVAAGEESFPGWFADATPPSPRRTRATTAPLPRRRPGTTVRAA